jgi:hypothetical protein
MKTHWMILSTALVFGGFAPSAQSDVIHLSDATWGWLTPTDTSGTGLAGNNYRAGFCLGPSDGGCMSGPAEFRNFFTFAIPQLDGPVISAIINAQQCRCEHGRQSLDDLSDHFHPSVFGFNHLGTGAIYGSRVYTAADGSNNPANPEGQNRSITLNAAGIAAITYNTTFGIGGRITTLGPNPTNNEFIFDSSGHGVCPPASSNSRSPRRRRCPSLGLTIFLRQGWPRPGLFVG